MWGSGQAALSWGWLIDTLAARETNHAIAYVLPEEGALLWGDNLAVLANSPNHYAAELFINFLLRPKIHAEYANTVYMAIPNDAALPFINPEIVNDPMIFPTYEDLKEAEIVLPLSAQGEKLYADIWARFLDAAQ
jgi:spermidine/putrescine transport system substrate-binding protein